MKSLATALLAFVSAFLLGSPALFARQASDAVVLSDLDRVEDLSEAFNSAAGSPRLVLLLSPT